MSKKSDYRFVVECNGQLLRLFSITQRDNNDLVIKPGQAEFYREFGFMSDDKQPRIANQKYSIHCSELSENNINAIVHTLDLTNGQNIKTLHYTKALKQNDLFAPLYIARCPDLNKPRYHTDSDRMIVNIGKYDPKICILYYMIVVSNKGHNLQETNQNDFDCQTVQFNKFAVTIFWSFFHMPSDKRGAKAHLLTLPPESITKFKDKNAEGYSRDEVVNMFRANRQNLHEEFKRNILTLYPNILQRMPLYEAIGFTNHYDLKRKN